MDSAVSSTDKTNFVLFRPQLNFLLSKLQQLLPHFLEEASENPLEHCHVATLAVLLDERKDETRIAIACNGGSINKKAAMDIGFL
jgi:hypothetical protein